MGDIHLARLDFDRCADTILNAIEQRDPRVMYVFRTEDQFAMAGSCEDAESTGAHFLRQLTGRVTLSPLHRRAYSHRLITPFSSAR